MLKSSDVASFMCLYRCKLKVFTCFRVSTMYCVVTLNFRALSCKHSCHRYCTSVLGVLAYLSCEPLHSHCTLLCAKLKRYYEPEEELLPPVKLEPCITALGDQVYLQEPLVLYLHCCFFFFCNVNMFF